MVVEDLNTKLFLKYANYQKSFNTICELNDVEGNKVQGFSRLVAQRVNHFHSLF